MTTVLVQATRGEAVESVHAGVVVVANTAGEVVAGAGDAEQVAYFRSAAKPFQAVPLVESGGADAFGLTAAELALCCASHNGSPHHQAGVAAMLAKIGLGPEALRCGVALPYDPLERARVTAGLVPRSPIQNNCSGKHTGMLAACVHLGYPLESYLEPEHPLQQRITGIVAEALRVPVGEIVIATDGCSLPSYGAPVRSFAVAFAALAAPERVAAGAGREHAAALNRLRAAMAAHPANIGGEGEPDTDLMVASGGRVVAKIGAEGLLCLALPEHGLGVAIKVADGSFRPLAVAAAAVLGQLGLLERAAIEGYLERQSPTIENHNGLAVGELRAAFRLI